MIDVFNAWWFVFAAVTAVLLVVTKKTIKTEDSKRKFIFWASVFVFVYLFLYKVWLKLSPDFDMKPWGELPLNLCNISTILLAVAMLTNSKALMCFCYLNCPLGALIALVFPEEGFFNVPLLTPMGIGYWGFHFLVIFICSLPVVLGLYKPKFKDIFLAVGLLFLTAAIMHGVNILMRATVYDEANYFYTFGLKGNALADFAYNILPVPLIWELVMLPVAAVGESLLVLLSAPWKNREKTAA